MTPPKTNAEALADYKAGGRQISFTTRDKEASAALDALAAKLGSQRAAIEYALKRVKPRKSK